MAAVHLHVSPMMLTFGRALSQLGLVKYVLVAERKRAHQGVAVISSHEVIDYLMGWRRPGGPVVKTHA